MSRTCLGWFLVVAGGSAACGGERNAAPEVVRDAGLAAAPPDAGLATTRPDAGPGPMAPVALPVERIDRCTARVRPATAADQAAFKAEVRARLPELTVGPIELNQRGDGVWSVVITDAPRPAAPPATAADVVALGQEVMARYGTVVGVQGGEALGRHYRAHVPRFGPAWEVEVSPGRESFPRIRVGFDAAGELRELHLKDRVAVAPPGVICDEPRVALDDPRIRRAVVGASVQRSDVVGESTTVVFTSGDVGAIATEVIRTPDPEVFRRVITVELRRGMWTAWLDADTAKLIRIVPNFVS